MRQHRRRSARRQIGLRLDQRSDRIGDLGAIDQAVAIEQGLVEGQRLNVDQAPVSGGIGGHETIVGGVDALGLDAVRCRLLPQLGDVLGREGVDLLGVGLGGLDLGFGRCRLVVAAKDDSGIRSVHDIGTENTPARVATVFPRIARDFFAARGRPVDIVPVSGAAEIAPHLGIADIVVDLTSTGSTLKMNGLREIETVLHSSAHLLTAENGPRNGDPSRAQELNDLVTALGSVIRARGQRYLMANVPRSALADVRAVLPGLNGPTVIEMADEGNFVAVHAVVSAATIYRTISQLRALGGEGILVTRIERLIP